MNDNMYIYLAPTCDVMISDSYKGRTVLTNAGFPFTVSTVVESTLDGTPVV